MEYADIVEGLEVRLKGANNLLADVYRLLAIMSVSGAGTQPEGKSFFVKRQTVYVLGRPAGVAPFQADSQQAKVPAGPRG